MTLQDHIDEVITAAINHPKLKDDEFYKHLMSLSQEERAKQLTRMLSLITLLCAAVPEVAESFARNLSESMRMIQVFGAMKDATKN